MRAMHKDEKEGDGQSYDAKDGSNPKTYGMEGVVVPYRYFGDCHILLGGIALWPPHGCAMVFEKVLSR